MLENNEYRLYDLLAQAFVSLMLGEFSRYIEAAMNHRRSAFSVMGRS